MKKKISLILAIIMLFSVSNLSVLADNEITVLLNGNKLEFDVPPVLMNNRTMVPMRAIFEALGCAVSWDGTSEQAIGIRNGRKVVVAIGSSTAYIDGKFVQIDQPPVIVNSRTLVPLRFVSEAYDCEVGWDGTTKTVSIKSESDVSMYHLNALSFSEQGDWFRDGAALKGRTTRDEFLEKGEEIPIDESAIAKANVTIAKDDTYRVWVCARDFKTNQQGTRYYTIGIDESVSDKTFGKHATDGFKWEDAGVFQLTKGNHTVKLIDTSAFHARCQGIFITSDLEYVPQYTASVDEICAPLGAVPFAPVNMFPAWTKELFVSEKTDAIENENFKVEFYKGNTENGALVQNAVYAKDNGNWVKIKDRSEDFAYMLLRADSSKYKDTVEYQYMAETTYTSNGEQIKVATDNIYEMAPLSWCIPTDYQVLDSNRILVSFNNKCADVTAIFEMDNEFKEPKISLNAKFNQDGAYSFILYNGDGVAYEDFDTVTAPMLYVKHAVPEKPLVITEPFMFTPMNTLYYSADRNKANNGKEFTSGIVVDPTIVRQGFSYPETAEYGTMFHTVDNKIRPHLVAPVLGDNSNFKAGDTYEFKFRLLNDFNNWYDTFKYVAEDMYHVADIRDNYYTSFNEALYNTTELWMDDFYGGWDDIAKSYYNMEAKDVTTQADPLEAAQRFVLTDDLEILEERTVPTIAYMLSRGTKSFQHTADAGGLTSSYITTEIPSPIGKPVDYNAGVYGGLYEMTQGRMPYLLKYAIESADASQISSISALYKYTGDKGYYNMLLLEVDDYIKNTSCMSGANYDKMFNTPAVYTDYIPLLNTLLLAYEATGSKEHLDAAYKAGQLTMTGVWNTGYHNGYDFNTFVIDEKMNERPHPHDGNALFFWHGDYQWRLGNVPGEYKSGHELGLAIPYEEVPGWLPAQAGLGTEHQFTPRYGAINQMSVWAGAMMRLSKYTGDDFFATQARNAMIGRFGTYGGYGRERYITHNQYPDYPYKGPDYTTMYYHHIPVFMGMLEDYLVNDVWYRSNANIEFPSVFQQGYAYFDMNRYGQQSGKFYGENDMWLWITPDVVTPDNRSVDYICARKEGVLGVALINEKTEDVTTTVTFENKIENASTLTGTATLLDANGNKSEITIADGKFTVTIPAKGIQSIIIHNPNVHNPSFVKEYSYSTELGQTVSEHINGKGYTIQLSDKMYHAYVYVTDKDLQKLEITYTADGKTETESCETYPFEFLIKVNDVKSDFTYSLKATTKDGKIKDMGSGLLRTLENSQNVDKNAGITAKGGVYYSLDGSSVYTRTKTAAPEFKNVTPPLIKNGRFGEDWKFVFEKDIFPFEVNESNVEQLKNIGVVMNWKHKRENLVIDAASYVTKAEMTDNGTRIALYVAGTFKLPAENVAFNNEMFNITVTLCHDSPTDAKVGVTEGETAEKEKIDFEPFELAFSGIGRSGSDWRFSAPVTAFPFEVEEDCMYNMRVLASFTHKTTGKVRILDNLVKTNEMRAEGSSTIVVVPATAEVPMRNSDGSVLDNEDYIVKLMLIPKDYNGDVKAPETVVTPSTTVGKWTYPTLEIPLPNGCGRESANWRFVVQNDVLPFNVTEGCMAGIEIQADFTHKTTGKVLVLKSKIKTNEMRADGVSTTLVVPPSDVVPLKNPDGTVFDNSEYDIKLVFTQTK